MNYLPRDLPSELSALSGDAAVIEEVNADKPDAARPLLGGHHGLLETTLPLLSNDWQRARLQLGDEGRFSSPPAARRKDGVELDLIADEGPHLHRRGENRFTLSYTKADSDGAQAAFLAAASSGGWPIAGDDASLALLTLAERISKSDIPVLLEGPTGTGKEVLARFIHRMSGRAGEEFVAVNCAAMPEAMLEGLLYGHRKGAFTGAGEAREGLFLAADGGTLLLDEIGEMPLALQAKLLRTLQEGEVLPLGATKPIKANVRIVACTNRRLSDEVKAGRFREDLLYRLNVFPIELAALKERPGDIAPLAFGMLLRHACRPLEVGRAPCWIGSAALCALQSHSWPGNVRELENVIRRAILLAGDASRISVEHIVFDRPVRAIESDQGSASPVQSKLSDVAFQSEAQAILAALESNGGHRSRTARALGISERTLRYRLASMRESGLLSLGARA